MSSVNEGEYLSTKVADRIISIIEGLQNGENLLPEREENLRSILNSVMRHHAHERDNSIYSISATWSYFQYSQVCILLEADIGVRGTLGIHEYLKSNPALMNKKNGENYGASSLTSAMLGSTCHRIQYGGAVSAKFYEMEKWLEKFTEDDKATSLYQYNEWKKMPESETIWKREDMQMENWCPIMDWDPTAKQWFESKRRIVPQKVQSRAMPNGILSNNTYPETPASPAHDMETQKPQKKGHKKEKSSRPRTLQHIEYPDQGSGVDDGIPQYGERTMQVRGAPTPESNGYPAGPQNLMVQRSGDGQVTDMQPRQYPQPYPNGRTVGSQNTMLQSSVVNEQGQVFQVWEPQQAMMNGAMMNGTMMNGSMMGNSMMANSMMGNSMMNNPMMNNPMMNNSMMNSSMMNNSMVAGPVMNKSMMLSQSRVQELEEPMQDLALYQQPQAMMSDQTLVPQGYTHTSGEKKKHSKGLMRIKN